MLPVGIRGLRKSYDGRTPVLDGIDLDIGAGELFFLLGGSGCGKTTLLRLLAGFLQPDAGSIRFGDAEMAGVPPERRDIGMVFQHYALWPHLTVAGNVAFGLEVRGVPAAERARRVDEALALVELSGYGGRRIGELSGGQQQRVALARAVVVRPKLLLLDEPLSNLDARLRGQMRQEIRRVCRATGTTAVYVTHDQHEALSTADRIALLAAGRVVQVGTPREIYLRPVDRTVAAFIGEANLLPGTVAGPGRVRCALGELAADATMPASGTAVTLCVRPERIRIAADGAIPATIVGEQYAGAHATWEVAVGDARLTVAEPLPPPRARGDAVRLAIAPADVVVLP